MFRFRRRSFFPKGVLRYLMLKTLDEKSMHGYDLIKGFSKEFSGVYRPSAGTIYPVLQALETHGYIIGKEETGKQVYSLTSKGKTVLIEIRDQWKNIVEERKGFNNELHNLANCIQMNYCELTLEQAEKIWRIIREARKNVSGIIFT